MKTIVATMLLTFAFNMTAEAGAGSQIFKAGARKNALIAPGFSPTISNHIQEGLKKVSAVSDAKHVVIDNTYAKTQNKIVATVQEEIMKDGSQRPVLVISTSEFYTQNSFKTAKRKGQVNDMTDSLNHILEILPDEANVNMQLLKPKTEQLGAFREFKGGDHDLKYTIVLDLSATKNGRKISREEYLRRVNAVSEIITNMASKLEGKETKAVLSRASAAVKARTQK